MEKVKDCSYGVIPVYKTENDFLFLVVKHNVGHWSFPKGHKEKGETDIEAAIRELKEETGISRCEVKETTCFVEKYEWIKNKTTIDKTVKFYIGFVKSQGVKISDEIQDYKWAAKEEALDLLTYKETKSIFENALLSLK